MRLTHPIRYAAALLIGLSCSAAHAADAPPPATPEQSLRAALGAWFASPGPFDIAPAEGGFAVRVPAEAASFGLLGADQTMLTATARQTASGAWNLNDLTVASPLVLHAAGAPTSFTLRIGKQNGHALLDASGSGDALAEGTADNIDLIVEPGRPGVPGPLMTQHFGHVVAQDRRTPVGNGRMDLMRVADATGWTMSEALPQGRLRLSGGALHLAGHVEALDTARFATASDLLLRLAAAWRHPAPNPPGTAPDRLNRDEARQLVEALRGIATSFQVEETAEGLSGAIGRQDFGVAHAGLGLAAEAPDGLLQLRLDVAIDGLALPALPPELAAYLPRHIALRPSLSGLDLGAATQLALSVLREGGPPPALNGALFGPDGLVLALEGFAVDIGPAAFSGHGRLAMGQDHAISGTAVITASGLNALIAQLGGKPGGPADGALTQAMPMLLMLKGLGRPAGDQLAWNLDWRDGHLRVNGTDMSALMGGNPR